MSPLFRGSSGFCSSSQLGSALRYPQGVQPGRAAGGRGLAGMLNGGCWRRPSQEDKGRLWEPHLSKGNFSGLQGCRPEGGQGPPRAWSPLQGHLKSGELGPKARAQFSRKAKESSSKSRTLLPNNVPNTLVSFFWPCPWSPALVVPLSLCLPKFPAAPLLYWSLKGLSPHPTVTSLRAAGSSLAPWDSPLT